MRNGTLDLEAKRALVGVVGQPEVQAVVSTLSTSAWTAGRLSMQTRPGPTRLLSLTVVDARLARWIGRRRCPRSCVYRDDRLGERHRRGDLAAQEPMASACGVEPSIWSRDHPAVRPESREGQHSRGGGHDPDRTRSLGTGPVVREIVLEKP
jgi:hypothetical protein